MIALGSVISMEEGIYLQKVTALWSQETVISTFILVCFNCLFITKYDTLKTEKYIYKCKLYIELVSHTIAVYRLVDDPGFNKIASYWYIGELLH